MSRVGRAVLVHIDLTTVHPKYIGTKLQYGLTQEKRGASDSIIAIGGLYDNGAEKEV